MIISINMITVARSDVEIASTGTFSFKSFNNIMGTESTNYFSQKSTKSTSKSYFVSVWCAKRYTTLQQQQIHHIWQKTCFILSEQYHYFSEKCVFGTFSIRFRIFDITLWLFSRNLIFDERKLFLILRKYVLNSFLYSYIKLDIKTEGS